MIALRRSATRKEFDVDDLIEALTIFRKYGNAHSPTHCEHDVLIIGGIGREEMTSLDQDRVRELSFFWDEDSECWRSYRFGSC